MDEPQLFVDLGLLLLAALGGGVLAEGLRQALIVGERLRAGPVGAPLAWPLTQSIAVGAAISVASTMVLLKFLLERGELDSPHGRVAVGISLIEDLAVVAMVILLPVLGAEEA